MSIPFQKFFKKWHHKKIYITVEKNQSPKKKKEPFLKRQKGLSTMGHPNNFISTLSALYLLVSLSSLNSVKDFSSDSFTCLKSVV